MDNNEKMTRRRRSDAEIQVIKGNVSSRRPTILALVFPGDTLSSTVQWDTSQLCGGTGQLRKN